MSITKIIIIFGIILLIFAGVIALRFNNGVNLLGITMKPNAKVTINKQLFSVEVVESAKDQQIGLTKYTSLKPEQGMLFLFDQSDYHAFWMRNMKFPIDMIFIDNATVVGVFENLPATKATDPNIPTYGGELLSNKVLEVSAGLVKKDNIKKGDTVTIERDL